MEENGAEGDDGVLGDGDAGSDFDMGADPGAVFDGYGFDHEGHDGIGPVVIAGAEVGALGDADVGADGDGDEVVDPGAFAEPDVVADGELPGVFDMDAGLDLESFAYGGAEAAEDAGFESVGDEDGVEQDEGFDDEPEGAVPEGLAWVVVAVMGAGEVNHLAVAASAHAA